MDDDPRYILIDAIEQMNIQWARTLIVENNMSLEFINTANMSSFIRNVALLNDKILLKEIVKYDTELAGHVLWSLLDNTQVAKLLVEAGADLKVRRRIEEDPQCLSFLHVLLPSNDPKKLELAELMVSHGALIDVVDINQRSVLKCAISGGASIDFIKEILKLLKPSSTDLKYLCTLADCDRAAELIPFYVTASSSDAAVITKRAQEALFLLTSESKTKMNVIEALLQFDISFDLFNDSGYTPFHNAVIVGNLALVEFLLRRNVDPNKKTAKGNTPLAIASILEDTSISTMLIKYGANIHLPNDYGSTPIHSACQGGSMGNILLLTRLGVDFNVVNKYGKTPFSLLSERNIPNEIILISLIVRQLALAASKGVEINACDMRLIQSNLNMFEMYSLYYEEILSMQRIEAETNIPYYTFLTENVEKTSRFTRREDVKSSFESLNGLKELFPQYFYDLRSAYVFAKAREDQLIDKEILLDEIFTEIFQFSMPYAIIHKITNYLCYDSSKNYFFDKMLSSLVWG